MFTSLTLPAGSRGTPVSSSFRANAPQRRAPPRPVWDTTTARERVAGGVDPTIARAGSVLARGTVVPSR